VVGYIEPESTYVGISLRSDKKTVLGNDEFLVLRTNKEAWNVQGRAPEAPAVVWSTARLDATAIAGTQFPPITFHLAFSTCQLARSEKWTKLRDQAPQVSTIKAQ
jgi:hypothetical protein